MALQYLAEILVNPNIHFTDKEIFLYSKNCIKKESYKKHSSDSIEECDEATSEKVF